MLIPFLNNKKIGILLFLIGICVCFFCAERERLNPIDPQNPETYGKPQGLQVYSEYDRVYLSWRHVEIDRFNGYQIYRKKNFENNFSPIYVTSKDSNSFIDKHLDYETKYVYRITVLGEDFETSPSDSVSIIPGPTFVWMGDVFNRYLIKLTHDCCHEIERIAVDGYPWAMELEKSKQYLWFTDVLINRLLRVDVNSTEQVVFSELSSGEPINVKLDENFDHVWLADQRKATIHVFNMLGSPIKEFSNFLLPIDLDLFLADGSCWITDKDKNCIFRMDRNLSTIEKKIDVLSPQKTDIDQSSGHLWILHENNLSKFDQQNNEFFTIDSLMLNSPVDLAVDSENKKCWVLDWYPQANQSKLKCFSEFGDLLFELSGFTYPEHLVVNPYDHGCIVADSGSGKVFKISATGEIISESNEYIYPYGLIIVY